MAFCVNCGTPQAAAGGAPANTMQQVPMQGGMPNRGMQQTLPPNMMQKNGIVFTRADEWRKTCADGRRSFYDRISEC